MLREEAEGLQTQKERERERERERDVDEELKRGRVKRAVNSIWDEEGGVEGSGEKHICSRILDPVGFQG